MVVHSLRLCDPLARLHFCNGDLQSIHDGELDPESTFFQLSLDFTWMAYKHRLKLEHRKFQFYAQTFIWQERGAILGEGWEPWDREGECTAIKLLSCFQHYSVPSPATQVRMILFLLEWFAHFKIVTKVLAAWQKYQSVIPEGTDKTNITTDCVQNRETFWLYVCKWMHKTFFLSK
jgi:hypothetical protein